MFWPWVDFLHSQKSKIIICLYINTIRKTTPPIASNAGYAEDGSGHVSIAPYARRRRTHVSAATDHRQTVLRNPLHSRRGRLPRPSATSTGCYVEDFDEPIREIQHDSHTLKTIWLLKIGSRRHPRISKRSHNRAGCHPKRVQRGRLPFEPSVSPSLIAAGDGNTTINSFNAARVLYLPKASSILNSRGTRRTPWPNRQPTGSSQILSRFPGYPFRLLLGSV